MRPNPSIATAALLLTLGQAEAAVYETVTTPTWINYWPGFNQFAEAGGGDDVIFDAAARTHPSNALPGQPLNPGGWSGSYHFSNPTSPPGGLIMGFFSGTTTIDGPVSLGTNTLSSLSTTYDQSVFNPYGNGGNFGETGNPTNPTTINSGPFSLELAPGFTHTSTFHPGNLVINDYTYRNVGDTSLAFHATNAALYVKPGQDPGVLFAGNQPAIDAFNFTINLLDADPATQGWTFLALESGAFEVVDPLTGGPLAGLEGVGGFSSQAYYSLDVGAAPVPVPAGLPLLLSGLAAIGTTVRARGKRS